MSSTTRTIDQLCLSPWNVRINEQDANATWALEASILDRHRRGRPGLILPLVVHPMKGNKDKLGVYAGGRRYRSIKALIDRGDLPADFAIEVVVRDMSDAELIEDSTAENLLRRDLRPYELFRAVTRAHRKGETPHKIAETLGQEITWVRQSIRLGNLAKPIFEALEGDRISLDQARAFAATEDEALQLSVFEALQDPAVQDWEKVPAKIHARLGVGDAERARLLRFVSPAAYTAAGGGFELDLFADGEAERGRICDVELLRRLVDDKLAGVRDEARVRTQRRDLRFVLQLPRNDYGTDYTLQVTPKVLNASTIELPDGDIVGFIRIPETGEPEVSYWWADRKAKHGTEKKPTPAERMSTVFGSNTGAAVAGSSVYAARTIADAGIKEDSGLTQDAIQTFRSVRRVIMRAAFVENAEARGSVGLDYLVFSLLRIELKRDMAHLLGVRGLAQGDHGPESAREHIAATEASRIWARGLHELQSQTFMRNDDQVEAFLDYRASSAVLKSTAAAVVAGMAVERSLNANGYRLPMHDALAAELDLLEDDRLRKFWQPTANMLELLPKGERLKIAEPFVESASFGPWARMKAGDITPLVLAAVTGASKVIRASLATAAASWVHPLLRFTALHAAEPVDAAAELQAAAE